MICFLTAVETCCSKVAGGRRRLHGTGAMETKAAMSPMFSPLIFCSLSSLRSAARCPVTVLIRLLFLPPSFLSSDKSLGWSLTAVLFSPHLNRPRLSSGKTTTSLPPVRNIAPAPPQPALHTPSCPNSILPGLYPTLTLFYPDCILTLFCPDSILFSFWPR